MIKCKSNEYQSATLTRCVINLRKKVLCKKHKKYLISKNVIKKMKVKNCLK